MSRPSTISDQDFVDQETRAVYLGTIITQSPFFCLHSSFPQYSETPIFFGGGLVEVQIEMGIHRKFDGMIFLSNKMPNFRGDLIIHWEKMSNWSA